MIGIDLGTTNSLVAVMRDGQPVTLKNELGEDLIPSVVAVAEDGTLLVGRAAKDRLVTSPNAGQACFKRDMGTDTTYEFGGRKWSPVECSALVLRELKRIAEDQLKTPVDSAVITVPAYFHDLQRQATVDAAAIAGLKVLRLLNEPTSAALAYGYRATDELNTLLVFDLGGGTFDVTLLESFEGVVEVKASSGESRLGGEDYTDAFAQWIEREFNWSPPAVDSRRWRERVEMLKRELSKQTSTTVTLHGKEAPITRDDFISATAEITARLRPVVRRTMRDAGLTPKQIDAVLLVGGASRMPVVFEDLRDLLGMEPSRTLDPDRVVALGAAVQQALVAGDSAVKDLVLTDVCPHTLGIETTKELVRGHREHGFFSPIIERNTMVPCSRSELFSTLSPEQDELAIQVYQGESRLVKDNRKIGMLHIQGLRARPGQKYPGQVDVRFTYDMNGLLEVDITIKETGKKVTKVFEQRPGTLSAEQIAAALRKLQPLKTNPADRPENRARLERANRLYADLSGEMRRSLEGFLEAFEAALISQERERIAATAQDLDTFMAPFFRENDG
ncbi:MAG: Hsp70 family protein [Prosthecobacter sp.]|uniref:Hsp70 family protein n=1 Tax=Prosthecobacter sp. TaxID=1965333 RepID=UPI003BAEBE56